MLFAMASGAIADMYDRRIVALTALLLTISGAAALSILSLMGLLTPPLLLGPAFMIGTGLSLSGPSTQSVIAEQVPPAKLPSAIALSAISTNLARSFGPAVGGLIVASTGARSGFALTACLAIPQFVIFLLWRRQPAAPRLPPEPIGRAMVTGIRFIIHRPPALTMIFRMLINGVAFGSLVALMPLVSRGLLHGGAGTYGILLGAFGAGAVVGALAIGHVRVRFPTEQVVTVCTVVSGLALIGVGTSHVVALSMAILFVGGAAWTSMTSLFGIAVQLSAPRWVAGRCVAAFTAALAGGSGIGAWIWGNFASSYGVSATLLTSGATLICAVAFRYWLRTPTVNDSDGAAEADLVPDPEVRLALTPRSGPIVVEIQYRVPKDQARPFYRALQQIQLSRHRNGGYGWSVGRDIADPELWIERFHCPSWMDYLRQRSRQTLDDRALDDALGQYQVAGYEPRVRRLLERPFGSVRWREDTPDPGRAAAALWSGDIISGN